MYCSKCGNPNDDAARFCAKCGGPLGAAPQNTETADNSTMRTATPTAGRTVVAKNPTVALVLSIFLGAFGAGQFYNGDWKKGLTMAAATLLLGVVTGGLVSLGIWIWSMIDSYKVASGTWKAW